MAGVFPRKRTILFLKTIPRGKHDVCTPGGSLPPRGYCKQTVVDTFQHTHTTRDICIWLTRKHSARRGRKSLKRRLTDEFSVVHHAFRTPREKVDSKEQYSSRGGTYGNTGTPGGIEKPDRKDFVFFQKSIYLGGRSKNFMLPKPRGSVGGGELGLGGESQVLTVSTERLHSSAKTKKTSKNIRRPNEISSESLTNNITIPYILVF